MTFLDLISKRNILFKIYSQLGIKKSMVLCFNFEMQNFYNTTIEGLVLVVGEREALQI